MILKNLIKKSWVDFKDTLPSFLKTVWWLLLILIAIPHVSSYFEVDESSWLDLFLSFGEGIVIMFLSIYSFVCLFQSRNIEISLSGGKIFIFWFASAFISIASSIATLFLVIPGLMILALSIFVPIFILFKNQGPIEAIASSSFNMEDQFIKLTAVFTLLWGIPMIIEYGLVYLSLNILLYEITSVSFAALFGYFIYSVAFNAYFELDKIHNKSMQPSAD